MVINGPSLGRSCHFMFIHVRHNQRPRKVDFHIKIQEKTGSSNISSDVYSLIFVSIDSPNSPNCSLLWVYPPSPAKDNFWIQSCCCC